jgi:hypothetical protein
MKRFRLSLSIGAAAFGLLLAAAPAKALNATSYVSYFSGSDGDSCAYPTSPCASIAGALAKTEPGGEIKCVDNHRESQSPAAIIDKPITIDCGAPGSMILGFNGLAAITVNLNEATYPNGVVTLRNLNINGLLGNSLYVPGTDGIRVIGGGAAVHVENCSILGFTQQGIDFAPGSTVDLFVRDTIISNNQAGGIVVAPSGAAGARVSLSNVRLNQNGGSGLSVTKASGAYAAITIEDTNVERNVVGLRAEGASAFIILSGSTIAHNLSIGLHTLTGGRITSSGNNTITLNYVDGAPTSTIPLK